MQSGGKKLQGEGSRIPEGRASGSPQCGVIVFPQADSPGRNLFFSRKMAAVILKDDP